MAFAGQGGGNGAGAEIGDITHSPTLDAIGVPALGGIGLLALAALLGQFGFRILKSNQGAGTQWLLAACVATVLASGTGGIKLINDAYAIILVTFEDENGDTITLFEGDVIFNGGGCGIDNGGDNGGNPGLIPVTNGTETTQFLTDISITGGPCEIREVDEPFPDVNAGNGGHLGICTDFPPLEMEPDDSCDIAVCCFGDFVP